MKIIYFLIFYFITVQLVNAETIWCKTMKIGCTTPEDRDKAFQNCQRVANQTFNEQLSRASVDSTIWQFAGYRSAYEYAEMRKRLMLDICVKNSPELRQ